MKRVNISEITELSQAVEHIQRLERTLLEREDCLADLSRAAELSLVSGQLQLMQSFVYAAESMLQDRLEQDNTAITQTDDITIIQA